MLGSAPCPAEVCVTSAVSMHLFFPASPRACVGIPLFIRVQKQSVRAKSSSLWLHLQFCGSSLSASTSLFSLLGTVMFVFQVRLTALGAPPPPPHPPRQSLLLALRPVLLSTELSSFSRLGGIIPSTPRAGLLLIVLQPL